MTTITKRYTATVYIVKEFVPPVPTDEFQPLKKYNFKTFTNKAFACVKKVAKNAQVFYRNPFENGYFGYNPVFPDPVLGDVAIPAINVVRARHIIEARDALVRAARVLVSLEKTEFLQATIGRSVWVDDLTDPIELAKLPERNLWYDEIDKACDYLSTEKAVPFHADMQLSLHGGRCLEWGQGFLPPDGNADLSRQFSFIATVTNNSSSLEIRTIDFATEPEFFSSNPDGPFYLSNFPFKHVFQAFLYSVEIFTPQRFEFFFKPEKSGQPGTTNYYWSSSQEFTINVPATGTTPAHTEAVPGMPIPPGGGAIFTFRAGLFPSVAAFPDNRPILNRAFAQLGNSIFPVHGEAFLMGNPDSQLPDAEFNFLPAITESFNIRKVCTFAGTPLEIVSINRLSGAVALQRCVADTITFNVGVTNFSDGDLEFNTLRLVFFWSVNDNKDPEKFGVYSLNTEITGNFIVPKTGQGQPPTLFSILVFFKIKEAIPDGVISGQELRCIAQLFVGDANSPDSISAEGPHELITVGDAGAQVEVFKPFNIPVADNTQCEDPVTPPPPPPPPPAVPPDVPPTDPPPPLPGVGDLSVLVTVDSRKTITIVQGQTFTLDVFISNTGPSHAGGSVVLRTLPTFNGSLTTPSFPIGPIIVAAGGNGITKIFSTQVTAAIDHPITTTSAIANLEFTRVDGTTGSASDSASWNVLLKSDDPTNGELQLVSSSATVSPIFQRTAGNTGKPFSTELTYTLKNTSSSQTIFLQDPFVTKLLLASGLDVSNQLQLDIVPPSFINANFSIPPSATKTVKVLASTTTSTISSGTVKIDGSAVGVFTASGLASSAAEVQTPGNFIIVGGSGLFSVIFFNAFLEFDNANSSGNNYIQRPAGVDNRQVHMRFELMIGNNLTGDYIKVNSISLERLLDTASGFTEPVTPQVQAKMLSAPVGWDNPTGEVTTTFSGIAVDRVSSLAAMDVGVTVTGANSNYLDRSTPFFTPANNGNIANGYLSQDGEALQTIGKFLVRLDKRLIPAPTGGNVAIGEITKQLKMRVNGVVVAEASKPPPPLSVDVIDFEEQDIEEVYEEIPADGTIKTLRVKNGTYLVKIIGPPYVFFNDPTNKRFAKFGGNIKVTVTEPNGTISQSLPSDTTASAYILNEAQAANNFLAAQTFISAAAGANELYTMDIVSSFIAPFSSQRGLRSSAVSVTRVGPSGFVPTLPPGSPLPQGIPQLMVTVTSSASSFVFTAVGQTQTFTVTNTIFNRGQVSVTGFSSIADISIQFVSGSATIQQISSSGGGTVIAAGGSFTLSKTFRISMAPGAGSSNGSRKVQHGPTLNSSGTLANGISFTSSGGTFISFSKTYA